MMPSTMIARTVSLSFALLFWFALAALGGCGAKLPGVPGVQGLPAAPGDSSNIDDVIARREAVAAADPDRGNCAVDVLPTARDQGLVGECWDPPGRVAFAPPMHVTPGMRQMSDDVWWFDMPAEGELDPNRGCPSLPGARGNPFPYEPYAEDGGRRLPAIPNLTGKSVAAALAALDALDAPLCVQTIVWFDRCEVAPGVVCDQNVHDEDGKVNLIVRGER